MRVVAGVAKGRMLAAPDGRETRPTSDRVRESIFNALGSLAVVEDAVVLDLFAGSGALGIEALSRGAARVTFVENGRAALAAIKANLDATGLADDATVVSGDALSFVVTGRATTFDLVLADPPYAFTAWPELFAGLDQSAMVVAESGRAIELPAPWQIVRQRRYGGTWVTFAQVDPLQ